MVTQDDVIYFVIADRFFNGDPNNDQDVDLANYRAFHGGDGRGNDNITPKGKIRGKGGF